METNSNPWFHRQLSYHQSSYIDSLSSPFNPRKLNDFANTVSLNGTLADVPNSKQCPTKDIRGLFDDVADAFSCEKAPYFFRQNHEETNIAYPAQKRFLVFDQSGDQTTLFYSPGVGVPVPPASEVTKPNTNFNTNDIVKTDDLQHQDPIFTYPNDEKVRNETESEMHEDTEDINALLYSDDDEYYDEDEDEDEASTGHSPSTMTNLNRKRDDDREEEEEVESNFGPNKRIKLSNEVSPSVGVASSANNPNLLSECEDDSESSCGGDRDGRDSGGFRMLGGTKRSMKDQIRETMSLLQSIIPGGKIKDKDVILIFDEAIDYLKSLKVKAQALGVHTI